MDEVVALDVDDRASDKTESGTLRNGFFLFVFLEGNSENFLVEIHGHFDTKFVAENVNE